MSMFTPAGDGGRPSARRSDDDRSRPWVLVVAVLVTIALVGGAWWWSQRSAGTPVQTASEPSCSSPVTSSASAKATSAGTPSAPPPSAVTTVNIYNATTRKGLAARVAAEMKRRGFRIGAIDNDPLQKPVTAAAQVRSGPAGRNAARTVAAQVGALTAYAPVVDKRKGQAVDLVLGKGFQALQPPAAAAAELKPKSTKRPATRC